MKHIQILLILAAYNTLSHAQSMPAGMLDRNALFDDIMGISEDAFKQRACIHQGDKPDIATAKKIVEAQQQIYPRAHSITQGWWAQPTLEQLRICVHARLSSTSTTPAKFGSLHLIIHDPRNPKKTHARALHAQFPNGFFQISSNFNALEERMGNYAYNLSDMNDAPAHGEESVLATMPAAIYRRYLMQPINLLEGLQDILQLDTDKNNTPIILGLKISQPITNHMMQNFTVGIHHNIIATSGYNDDGKMIIRDNDPFNRPKPAYNSWLPDSGPDVIRVNHIFTAAHNINQKTRDDIIITPEQQAIARAIILATYEATILAAADNGAKDLILVMLRPEVFHNDPAWVAQGIARMTDIIIASGMRVHMVIRHRVPSVQQKFINAMGEIIEDIERKKVLYKKNPASLLQALEDFFSKTASCL